MSTTIKRTIICCAACLFAILPSLAQPAATHPWQGKRVAYLGDSVTDPRNKAATTKYWGLLSQWLGIEPFVYAVSGRQWNDIPRQAEALKAEHGDDVDAIIIFMGTNDFNKGVPIGQWYTETTDTVEAAIGEPKKPEPRLHRTLSMDVSTYRGSINVAMSRLKQLYPTNQIVLLTPIHRGGFYPNEKNWQPTEDYANRAGEYIDSYVQSVKEAANVWAVPVIDLNALCGLYPMADEHAIYFNDKDTDRLHPNDVGHHRIASTLMFQLWSLPCEL